MNVFMHSYFVPNNTQDTLGWINHNFHPLGIPRGMWWKPGKNVFIETQKIDLNYLVLGSSAGGQLRSDFQSNSETLNFRQDSAKAGTAPQAGLEHSGSFLESIIYMASESVSSTYLWALLNSSDRNTATKIQSFNVTGLATLKQYSS